MNTNTGEIEVKQGWDGEWPAPGPNAETGGGGQISGADTGARSDPAAQNFPQSRVTVEMQCCTCHPGELFPPADVTREVCEVCGFPKAHTFPGYEEWYNTHTGLDNELRARKKASSMIGEDPAPYRTRPPRPVLDAVLNFWFHIPEFEGSGQCRVRLPRALAEEALAKMKDNDRYADCFIEGDGSANETAAEAFPGGGSPEQKAVEMVRDEWCAEYTRTRDELASLRQSLERLAARWEEEVSQCGGPVTITMATVHCNALQLRRVLSGETPPEPGVEWSNLEIRPDLQVRFDALGKDEQVRVDAILAGEGAA